MWVELQSNALMPRKGIGVGNIEYEEETSLADKLMTEANKEGVKD